MMSKTVGRNNHRNPDTRILVASRVKPQSDETKQNPSAFPLCSRFMASKNSGESAAFLPVVYLNCCKAWMA